MQPILEVSHVTKTFRERGGQRFRAVDDISITVEVSVLELSARAVPANLLWRG